MISKIEEYSFGSIKIDNDIYSKDLWIISGKIKKRDKSIAKSKYGSSHKISREELKRVVTEKTRRVIIGSGDSGLVSMTNKAMKYLEEKRIDLKVYRTGELARMKMEMGEEDSGIIHLTC